MVGRSVLPSAFQGVARARTPLLLALVAPTHDASGEQIEQLTAGYNQPSAESRRTSRPPPKFGSERRLRGLAALSILRSVQSAARALRSLCRLEPALCPALQPSYSRIKRSALACAQCDAPRALEIAVHSRAAVQMRNGFACARWRSRRRAARLCPSSSARAASSTAGWYPPGGDAEHLARRLRREDTSPRSDEGELHSGSPSRREGGRFSGCRAPSAAQLWFYTPKSRRFFALGGRQRVGRSLALVRVRAFDPFARLPSRSDPSPPRPRPIERSPTRQTAPPPL